MNLNKKVVLVNICGMDSKLSIRLSAEMIIDCMETEEFIHYCEVYCLVKERLKSYYCVTSTGRIVSPRWMEYLRDRRIDLFEASQEKSMKYSHSCSAVKIFEKLGINVEHFKYAV